MTKQYAPHETGMSHAALVGLSIAVAAAIFAFDLSLPLGVAGGVPYIALVMLAVWWPWRPTAFALAAAATALTIIGYLASPSGGIHWMVLTNRGLALFAIWVTAVMVFERRRATDALRVAHDDLERRVAKRTVDLEDANRALTDEIHCRTRAEDALRASEAQFAGIVEIAPEAIITVGADQRIRLYNQGAEAIFGYAADEALGQPLDMLMPTRFRENHPKNVESFACAPDTRRTLDEHLEIVALRKDGTEFPAEGSLSKLELSGESLFTIMLHDISDRKHAEETLLAAKQHAELANRSKSEFLANMSHELRTPLNAIIGFSELIASATFGPLGNPKYRDYAKDINDSGQHLLELINDILDISKVEAGEVELYDEEVDVPRVVSACLKIVKERAQVAGLVLETDIADELPPLRADARKLKQILINLLSNAVKFTPDGGTVKIGVWCRLDAGYVIQVADSGIGIASEDIPKVLRPFGQVDGTLSRKYAGTGLGLPLTKSYVEMHGGSFDLQSEFGAGTTVTVRFPADRMVIEAATDAQVPARLAGIR